MLRIVYENKLVTDIGKPLNCVYGVYIGLPAKMLPSIKPPQLLADRFVEFFTEKLKKNMLNILYFPQFATHHPRLSSPYVFHFLYCN